MGVLKRECITDNSVFNSLKQLFGEMIDRLGDHSVQCIIKYILVILT